jgi:AraC-like DNA-binding protein
MARPDPHNRSRYWHAPGVPGMDLLQADFTTHSYAPHVHDSLVVAVTEAGGSEFTSRGRTQLAGPQALLVFNPAEPHSGRMAGSARWRYRSFYVGEPALRGLLGDIGLDAPRYFTANVFTDPDLIGAFLRLHGDMEAEADPLLRRERLVQAFGTLLQRHGQSAQRAHGSGESASIARAQALMHDSHAERLTLEQLAGAADLTPFQLIAAFKRSTGLTPHAFLTQVRLRAAIARLHRGAPLAQAALDAGFYDQSALTTHFKRAFGMTPLQYVAALPGRGGFNFRQ